jgi:hypothetical protein
MITPLAKIMFNQIRRKYVASVFNPTLCKYQFLDIDALVYDQAEYTLKSLVPGVVVVRNDQEFAEKLLVLCAEIEAAQQEVQ